MNMVGPTKIQKISCHHCSKITRKGRRQEKRRKGKFEVLKPKENSRMGTCSNCKLQGHNYTSCSVPLRPDLAIRKNNHRASGSKCSSSASSSKTWCKCRSSAPSSKIWCS